MASFKDLYNHVMPDVRGVEPELVNFQIRTVCRDWLKATTQWRETLALITTPGMVNYRITPRAGGQVGGVLRFGDSDSNFDLPNLSEAQRQFAHHDQQPRQPRGWRQVYPGVITFDTPPDDAYTYEIEVYKLLTLDPEDDLIPDDLFDNHADDLGFGIKARLQSMSSKPWTDTTMATVNNTYYTKAKFAARAAVREGGKPGHMRVSAPSFTGRRRR